MSRNGGVGREMARPDFRVREPAACRAACRGVEAEKRYRARVRLVAALRHRDFRLFFAGQAVSQLGDAMFFLAIAWHTLQVTGTASGVGLVAGAFMGAQVTLLLVGGLVVDRFSRRKLLVASDVGQATLALTLAVVTLAGYASLPVMIAFAALFGAAQAVAMPALSAVVPDTVPPEHLTSANSLHQGTRTLSTILGPLVGGVLVALWGPGAAYAVNGGTFVVSATMLLLSNIRPAPPSTRASVLQDAKEGARYVAGRAWLWMGIAIFSIYNVAEAGARNVGLPVFVDFDLMAGAAGLGALNAATAVGMLAAYVTLGSIDYARVRGAVAYGGALLGALAVAAMWWAPTLVAAAVLSVARGVAIAAFSMTWEVAMQSSVAPNMRGRVISLDMLGSFGFLPLALPLMGVALDALGARTTFLFAGIAMAAVSALGLASRRARSLGAEAASRA